jgi:predicted Zn-dependent protease
MRPPTVTAVARLLGLCALTVASACATNPATGNSQLMLVGVDHEIEIGRKVDEALIGTPAFYRDSAWQRYVADLGHRIAATSERPSLPWTFRVLDDPGVNAFSLPGGFVYVTRGILAHLGSGAQLAAVLGHEIGHVTARHALAQMSSRKVWGIGALVASIAAAVVSPGWGAAAGNTQGSSLDMMFLSHSRADERQADELGVRSHGPRPTIRTR